MSCVCVCVCMCVCVCVCVTHSGVLVGSVGEMASRQPLASEREREADLCGWGSLQVICENIMCTSCVHHYIMYIIGCTSCTLLGVHHYIMYIIVCTS